MRYAVVDVETSGFGKTDRILEIGLILVDGTEIVEEFETVINPMRNINNSDIHGLDPTTLSLAPTFEELENKISSYLNDRILVAHNLPFDKRMLIQELIRFKSDFDLGNGICTLKYTGMKLGQAANHFGISLENAHTALDDARAAAQILTKLDLDFSSFMPAKIESREQASPPRVLHRPHIKEKTLSKVSYLSNLNGIVNLSGLDEKRLYYFDTLSYSLADLVLSDDERSDLNSLASELGLSEFDQESVHLMYFEKLVEAAKRDGFISEYEKNVINAVATALNIKTDFSLPESNEIIPRKVAGLRVCFTGAARDANGQEIERYELQKIAESKGFIPVDSVTKKNCDLVVAADANSMSGKTKKARSFGIPVMSVTDFLES